LGAVSLGERLHERDLIGVPRHTGAHRTTRPNDGISARNKRHVNERVRRGGDRTRRDFSQVAVRLCRCRGCLGTVV